MKRYWKLVAIVVVIVFTIGTFYSQSILAKSNYPKFAIKTVSGNEAELDSFEIWGTYESERVWLDSVITAQGTTYRQDRSYLEQINGNPEPEIKRLQKEHRNFMRGKMEDESKYFEDQNNLIYATVNEKFNFNGYEPSNFTFEVVMLDKNSKKKTAFKMPVPEQRKYYYIAVEDVQFVNGGLKIITRNYVRESDTAIGGTEMHVYHVNIAGEKLANDEIINFTGIEINNNQSMNVFSIRNEEKIGPNKYVIFSVNAYGERVMSDGSSTHESTNLQLVAYNLETNEQEKIELPKEIGEEINSQILVGNILYLSEMTDNNQLEIFGYNVETGEIEIKQTFDLPPQASESEDSGVNYVIKNDKVYIAGNIKSNKVDASIIIGDIHTGEILYEGSIELDKDSQNKKLNTYRMQFHHMVVK